MDFKIRGVLMTVLAGLVLIGCSKEKEIWQQTTKKNTLAAYESFMKAYPEGKNADTAAGILETYYYQMARKQKNFLLYEERLQSMPQTDPKVSQKLQTRYEIRLREIKSLYQEAEALDTILSYKKFLNQWDKGPLTGKARMNLNEFYRDRQPEVKSAKSIKVILKSNFPEKVETFARIGCNEIIQVTGLDILHDEAASEDLAVFIEMTGTGITKRYGSQWNYGTYTTGAKVRGSISMQRGKQIIRESDFVGYEQPSETVVLSASIKSATNSPFYQALILPGSLSHELIKILTDLFGSSFLEQLITKKTYAGQDFTKGSLYTFFELLKGKDSRVIRNLSSVMENIGFYAGNDLIKILKNDQSEETIMTLTYGLRNRNEQFRSDVIWELTRRKDPRSVEALINSLADNDNQANQILKALETITGKNFGRNIQRWLEWRKTTKTN